MERKVRWPCRFVALPPWMRHDIFGLLLTPLLIAEPSRSATRNILVAIRRVTERQFRCINHFIVLIQLIFRSACTLDALRSRPFVVTRIVAVTSTATLAEVRRGSFEESFILFFIKTLVLGILFIVCVPMGKNLDRASAFSFLAQGFTTFFDSKLLSFINLTVIRNTLSNQDQKFGRRSEHLETTHCYGA